MKQFFTSVHNHTEMSNVRLLDCINKPNALIDRALELDYNGIAITDHETMSALPSAYEYMSGLKSKHPDDEKIQNFKFIFGNEAYIVNNLADTKKSYKDYGNGFYHLVLLAKNYEGYHLLKRLSSQAWVNSYRGNGMERVPLPKSELKRIVEPYKGNLICSTACLGSEFAKTAVLYFVTQQHINKSEKIIQEYVSKNKSSYNIEQEQLKLEQNKKELAFYRGKLDEITDFYVDLFGDDFYIELQPSDNKEQIAYNRVAVDYAKHRGLKWIVTTDSHYLTKEDAPIHAAYLNSKDGDREVADFYSTTYLLTTDEIREYLLNGGLTEEEVDLAFNNTKFIYDSCEEYNIFKPQEIPIIEIDERLESLLALDSIKEVLSKIDLSKYENISAYLNSENSQEQYFIYACIFGMLNKKLEFNELHLDRIDLEIKELIGITNKMDKCIAQYYVTAQKLIELMWNEGDSLVGPARGSVTGYFTAYLLDIIQMNALEWDLPHWRHISESRPEYPDIDIDSQALKRGQILQAVKKHFGAMNVLNICTFGTEGSKNALLTACRGLGIDSDTGLFLSSLIPAERGFNWTLKDCFEGNEEKGRSPVSELVREVGKHKLLKETAMRIEGLVNKRSSHASGLYIFNDGFINYVPMMKTPSGLAVTQYNMDDADKCGAMKFDFLTIEALDKIRKTMDLLIDDGLIEWQGSLKATYDKYLHPDVLEYDNLEMWEKVGNNDIISLFQYDTQVGLQAAKKLRPKSLTELANGNSLMRLMPKEGEMNPIDKYALFKEDPNEWEKEMSRFKLSDEEKKTMHKYFDYCSGVPSAQEDIMRMVMAKEVLNKDLVMANKFRKVIAKKKMDEIAGLRDSFFEYGSNNNTSVNLLKYVWQMVIEPQLGYGFSINHSVPYSAIALQEMNLAHKYSPVYWNCACLCVDAGAKIDESDIENEEIDLFKFEDELTMAVVEFNYDDGEDDEEDEEDSKTSKAKKKSTDYGAIANAIGNMKSRGVNIDAPDINDSSFDFRPDAKNNKILFGLKGINAIGDDIIENIINNRPYTSLEDLKTKVKLTKTQVINLIKAGALTEIEQGKTRRELLLNYLDTTADTKKVVTIATVPTLCGLGLIPKEQFLKDLEIFSFNKYVKSLNKGNKGEYYVFDNRAIDYFIAKIGADVVNYEKPVPRVNQKWWDKYYTTAMDGLREYIKANKASMLEVINNRAIKAEYEKYGAYESERLWEMESTSYYHEGHELDSLDTVTYEIENFFDLPEEPAVKMIVNFNNRPTALYELSTIAGTVVDKNKTRKTVSLLTPEGVVTVKFYASSFSYFDKQISEKQSDGTKKVMEKSWFKRGSKLIITGIRRGDQFVPKVYKNTNKKNVYLITKVNEDGSVVLRSERYQSQDEI